MMPYLQNPSDVSETDSFEYWQQAICKNYSISEFQRDSGCTFSAKITAHAFGSFLLTDASSSSIGITTLIRGPIEIQQDPRDHFMLFFVIDGEITVVQHGREACAHSGDFFIYDQTSPFTLQLKPQYRTVILTIPRPLLESRVPRMYALTACTVAGDSKLGALVGTIVRQLVGLEQISSDVVNCVATSTLDLVSAALTAEGLDNGIHHAEHRLLNSVKGYMLANLYNAQLDVDTIAKAQNIGRRTLSRIFAADGTTPMRWLWQQRLCLSYRHLAEGHIKTVTDATFTFGFNDVSHFSRSFKATFGKSPHSLIRPSTAALPSAEMMLVPPTFTGSHFNVGPS
jgi:AraC-like DNA-binding protein